MTVSHSYQRRRSCLNEGLMRAPRARVPVNEIGFKSIGTPSLDLQQQRLPNAGTRLTRTNHIVDPICLH